MGRQRKGKVKYPTKKQANRTAYRTGSLNSYKCDKCDGYHAGHARSLKNIMRGGRGGH